MKKLIYASVAWFALIAMSEAQAQQGIQKQVVQLGAPTIVNFSKLAQYELQHPVAKTQRYIEQGEDREENMKFKPGAVPAGAPVFDVTLAEPQKNERIAATSPAPKISFNGTMDAGVTIPPDIEGAAGPIYLMETTNQEIDIISKAGVVTAAVSTSSFFSSTGGSGFFDPHVVYDPSYGRYLVCIGGNLSNGNSGVFLAVSETNDPTGNWYEYSHDGTGNTTDLLDFPLLGYNTNWVVVTGNDFLGNGNFTGKIFVFNRASLYSGSVGTVTDFADANIFSLSPAQTQDNTQASEYMVMDYNGDAGGKGYVQTFAITGPVNSPAYSAINTIGVNQPWDENPVEPTQKGSAQTLDLPDARIGGGSVFINGSLWFSHTVFLPAGSPTRASVDWWEVDPAASSVQQFGRIDDPTAATHYFYPAISVNALGDALLGYCESGTGIYPSTSYSFHANTDASGVMEATYVGKAGLASYYKTFGGTRNRYGDFTGTGVDPTDNSFWNFNEFASTGNNWGTYISNVLGSGNTPCLAPSGLVTSAITATSATFSWSTISGAVSYNVQYRKVGTGTWTTANTASTSYTATGLTGNTNYEWQVQTVCTGSSTSSFTSSTTFTTLVPCNAIAPTSSAVSVCSGNSAVLTAAGTDTIFWYAVPAGGTSIGTGHTYTSPALTTNKTYYAESDVFPAIQQVGAANNTIGAGGYFTNTATYHDLIFDCYTPVTLVSVLVYASGAGNRTITLMDQLGNTLNQTTVNIPDGSSHVNLNFDLPIGTAMQLGITGNVSLYRNTAGAVYPYTLPNVLSITGDNAGTSGYYYYFYDWRIQAPACKSLRTAVNVTVLDPVSAFTSTIVTDSVSFSDQSSGATSWSWNFGDGGTSTQQNPSHVYSTSGTFTVKEIACNGSCCDTIQHSVTIVPTGLSTPDAGNTIKVYPNPFKDNVLITFGTGIQNASYVLKVTNSIGQLIAEKSLSGAEIVGGYTLNTSMFAKGIYTLTLVNEQGDFIQKIIKE